MTDIISTLFILGLILVPVFLFIVVKKEVKPKFNFIVYLLSGLILTAGIMWTFAWWANYSDELLMSNYGYDFDAMNDLERYKNVEKVNLEKVKQLEIGFGGIGWPLKAILSFAWYSPYLLMVYFIGQIFKILKQKIS